MATANPAPSPLGSVSGTDSPAGGLGRAIESTLRLATSWWGLLTAYAGGITLAIVAFQKLEEPLKGSPVWLRAVIVSAPLILALVFHVIPTLVEQGRKKRLAEITGELQPGYFSLAPREEEERFTRADGKHQEILRWLEKSPAPLMYLTGLSGSGKSSLLGAFVLPQLQRQNTVVLRLRGYQDLVAQLEQELMKPGVIWQKPPGESGEIRSLLERAARYIKPRRLLIVYDQFEEFVILHSPEQRQQVEQLFASLNQTPIEGLNFLLVFRSDYIGLIEDLKLPLLVQDNNWKEVPPFTESAARHFIQNPDSGIKVDEALLRDVLREAAEVEQAKGLIRPITINLCGLVLGRFASGLPRGFRPGGLIRGFLRESLMISTVREVAPRLIPYLITNYVTKRPRTITELTEETGLRPGEVRGCLRVLGQSDRAIVRALDSEQQTWEISHDFLVPLLDSIVARRTVSLWKKSRPWLPWIGAASLVLCLAIVSNLKQDPSVALRKLGWNVSWTKEGLTLQSDRIPVGDTLQILRQVHEPITLQLHEFDSRVCEWRVLKNPFAINLSGTNVSDVGLLKELPNLTTLRLSFTPVDVGSLRNLKSLTTLDLSNTQVSDVGPLEGLESLITLDLYNTRVSNVEPLKKLKSLTNLDLDHTQVSDVGPLEGLENLTILKLSYTPVDVESLRELKSLTTLDLSSTPVRRVDPLKDLKNLTSLNLSYTPLSNVEPLAGLKSLTSLYLRGVPVSDVELLKKLPNLAKVDLELTNVSDADVNELRKALPKTEIKR